MSDRICLVCGEDATKMVLGNTFCPSHEYLLAYESEDLEDIVILRLRGASPQEIEAHFAGKARAQEQEGGI